MPGGVVGNRVDKDEQTKHRGSLGKWKNFAWYYTDGYMSLYICPNPQNVQNQEWILK